MEQMDWLRQILEKTELADGKLDVETIMKQVVQEFPNHAVSKGKFDSKVEELEKANETIGEIKKSGEANEELKKKIGDYETQIKDLKAAAERTSRTYALKEKLSMAGVLDPEYLIYKHGGIDKFTFDKEGNPVGVEEVLTSYKDNAAMAHLFKEEPKRQSYIPKNGESGGNTNPFSKESFNMTEQAKLYKSSPEQARALAAAAGVTI